LLHRLQDVTSFRHVHNYRKQQFPVVIVDKIPDSVILGRRARVMLH
jgi:hypothetical protein